LDIFKMPLDNYVSILFQQAAFALGSAIWYKLSIVKTIVAQMAIGFVIIIALTIMISAGVFDNCNYCMSPSTFTIVLNTGLAVFAVVFWALSYYLYTRSQIVGKIFNRK
ncbi:MAG: hypothetical protein ACI30W_02425, partial [Muribaculaceae bacterium]